MRFSKQAQSVIEYVVVFVLVGLGIAIMGPYAIRSINGHMKAWEDAVDDSINDPLLNVDTSTLPVPKCACSPILPHGCGIGGCDQLSMRYQRDCGPLGCAANQLDCASDLSCCATPPPAQQCGGCVSDGSCCTPWTASGSGSCRGNEGCPIGLVHSTRQCGGSVGTQTSCQPSSTCVFECTGNDPDNATLCFEDDKGLRRDALKVPVDHGACSPPEGIKCEWECHPDKPTVIDGACSVPPGCRVDLPLSGDCLCVACPLECPYPVGCDVTFVGRVGSGCVANVPTSSGAYFQEGVNCQAGELYGTLICGKSPGPGLNAENCRVNLPNTIYVSDMMACPCTRNCDKRPPSCP